MLEFRVEWEEAPGVRSPALAATWARIEISVDAHPVTRFWSSVTNAGRTGVYGSAFPLACWIARNWWNLLYEGLAAPEVLSGARRAHAHHHAWLERHNLVFAREGMAYPDLSIFREDDRLSARWVSDTERVTTPGRFLEEGTAQLDLAATQAALAQLVESVLARVEHVHEPSVQHLIDDWKAVETTSGDERELCIRLAALGLDPYAADLDTALEEQLSDKQLPRDAVLRDLLAATTPSHLVADIAAIRELESNIAEISQGEHHAQFGLILNQYDPFPYCAGYQRASVLRRRLGLSDSEPASDLDAVINKAVGVDKLRFIPQPSSRSVEAVVQRNGACAMVGTERSERALRFLRARALHHWLFVTTPSSPRRLLTRANDWQQAASRAFAAELLAPAAALAAHLEGMVDWDVEEQLADKFKVSHFVIGHQLENHGLA